LKGYEVMDLSKGADAVSLFCRININTKRDFPIRSSEMGLLIFIAQSEKPPASTDAVAFFKVSKPMVAAMVRSLEKKGYITRGGCDDGQRRFTLLLTNKAKSLVEQTTEEYFKNMAVLREGLGSEEYDRLIALLEKSNKLLLENQKGEK
jgi:DNA-binding MarR family transcriptional regulator